MGRTGMLAAVFTVAFVTGAAHVGAQDTRRGYLGIQQGHDGGPGVEIGAVVAGTPAEKAGFKAGDRITRIGDRELSTWDELRALVGSKKPGELVAVTVQRNGWNRTFDVVLATHPDDAEPGFFGFTAAADGRLGAPVTGSPADQAGIAAGDRIIAVGEKSVATLDEAFALLRAKAPGETVKVRIDRDAWWRDFDLVAVKRPREEPRVETPGLIEPKTIEPRILEVPKLLEPKTIEPRILEIPKLLEPKTIEPRILEIPKVLEPKPAPHAFLGVQLEGTGGDVVVSDVVTGAPAERSGFKKGDRVRLFDGKAVSSVDELRAAILAHHPGDRVKVRIEREDGWERTFEVELAGRD